MKSVFKSFFKFTVKNIYALIGITLVIFLYNNCAPGFSANSTGSIIDDSGGLNNGPPKIDSTKNSFSIKTQDCKASDAYSIKKAMLTRLTNKEILYSILDLTSVDVSGWQEFRDLPIENYSVKGLANEGINQIHRQRDVRSYQKLMTKVASNFLDASNNSVVDCNYNSSKNCFQSVINNFANTAHRGAPNTQLISLLSDNYDNFDDKKEAMSFAIEVILMSPEFLYKLKDFQHNGTNNQLLLAERLSYFLWSSQPDETLLQLAKSNQLSSQTQLKQQIDRMLQDARFERFYDTFVMDWLQLDKAHKNFTSEGKKSNQLISSLINEPKKMFQYIVEQDKPINDLLVGNYTYADKNIENYYNLANIGNNNIVATTSDRMGLLLQAAPIAGSGELVTHANSTHPTVRGYNLLKKFFCLPPEALPAELEDVVGNIKDTLNDNQTKKQSLAFLQTGECGQCHIQTDPIGLSLENYDSFGNYRQTENGLTIDPSGRLPSGESFSNATEMIHKLNDSSVFSFENCLTHTLVSYARSVTLTRNNLCETEKLKIQKQTTFKELIHKIVLSDSFLR